MLPAKANIIARLQKEILLLQGFKPCPADFKETDSLYFIASAFPHSGFPAGMIHEFFCYTEEEVTASSGFISGILSSLVKKGGISVWITSLQNIFPPALTLFGIDPDKIIFLNLKRDKEKLWAMEEAMKCDAVCCVVAEISELSFTESRRFQLATEQSKVTGFIVRRNPKNISTACVARWKIKSIRSGEENNLPGVGFPRWNVELVKIRNGQPGKWQMEWKSGKIQLVQKASFVSVEEQRKIV